MMLGSSSSPYFGDAGCLLLNSDNLLNLLDEQTAARTGVGKLRPGNSLWPTKQRPSNNCKGTKSNHLLTKGFI